MYMNRYETKRPEFAKKKKKKFFSLTLRNSWFFHYLFATYMSHCGVLDAKRHTCYHTGVISASMPLPLTSTSGVTCYFKQNI